LAAAAVILRGVTPDLAWNLVWVGGAGLLIALTLNPPPRITFMDVPEHEAIRWQLVVPGILCMGALLMWNLVGAETISSHIQFLLLCGSVGLIALGFGGQLLPVERSTFMLMGALTLLAFLLRVIALDSAIRFFIDEANFADAMRIAQLANVPLLARFSGITAFPWIYPYMESVTVDIFGRNLVGLRMVSVVVGTLTIPAVYILARALFNKPTALAAALLFATFPPHIHFSRIAINNIADPLFGTLALGWMAWGWRTGRRSYFALAGAAFGLTQYFYDGGRLLFPPLIVAWLVCCVMLMWVRGDETQGRAGGALVMLLIAALVAAPIYVLVASHSQTLSQRFDNEGAWGLLSLSRFIQRMIDTFRLYVQIPESSYFYLGNTPMLLIYMSAPFLAGIATAVWRTLRLEYDGLLLLFWLVATAVGNSLLASPFVSARYPSVFPALILLATLGIVTTLHLIMQHPRLKTYVLYAVVVVFAAAQTIFYFAVHVPLYNDQARVHEDSQDAAFRSADFPPHTQVYFIADPVAYHAYARAVIWLLRDDLGVTAMSPSELTATFLLGLPHTLDHAFYLLPNDYASLELIRRYFVVNGPFHSPYPLPPNREFVLYYAARAENAVR
jgi:4-amino-4-deoxy-L-arabinose transferase-like glycosyltransferase